MSDREHVAGVILAGGRSRRFAGGAKESALLRGVPLIEHVIARARPQVAALAISRSAADADRRWDLPVVVDRRVGQGPLAGLHAGLEWASSEVPTATHLATFAGDTPLVAPDLVARLYDVCVQCGAPAALPSCGGVVHPALGLWSLALLAKAERALHSGSRALLEFAHRSGAVLADFDDCDATAFFNVNTRGDLAELEEICARRMFRDKVL